MTLEEVKRAIVAAVVSATGLPPLCVGWARRPQAFGEFNIVLDFVTEVPEGPARIARAESGQGFAVEVSRAVVFTVAAKCEAVTKDPSELAARLAAGLEFPSIRDELSAAGVTLVGFPLQAAPAGRYQVGQREVSAVVLDAQFRAVIHRGDPQPQSTIEHVGGERKFTDDRGVTTTEAHQFDRE